MPKMHSTSLHKTILALFVVLVIPSFFYRGHGTRVTNVLTGINGLALGMSIYLQEPLILAINAAIALMGTCSSFSKHARIHHE